MKVRATWFYIDFTNSFAMPLALVFNAIWCWTSVIRLGVAGCPGARYIFAPGGWITKHGGPFTFPGEKPWPPRPAAPRRKYWTITLSRVARGNDATQNAASSVNAASTAQQILTHCWLIAKVTPIMMLHVGNSWSRFTRELCSVRQSIIALELGSNKLG